MAIKELLKQRDSYDRDSTDYSPSRRAEVSDTIVDILLDVLGDDLLSQIAEAGPDRVVVLPIRPCDSVWDRNSTEWTVTQVEHRMYGNVWVRCGHKGTDDYMAFSADEIGDGIYLEKPEITEPSEIPGAALKGADQ
jgi:hypothetical protein